MRQVYEKRQASVEAMVQSKGDISCAFDARAVFLPESFFLSRNVVEGISHTPWGRMQRIGAGQISMKHSFEVGLLLIKADRRLITRALPDPPQPLDASSVARSDVVPQRSWRWKCRGHSPASVQSPTLDRGDTLRHLGLVSG